MTFENLSKQVEAYFSYLITASVTAFVAVGGTLGVQAFRNWLNPGPLTVNAVTGDILAATHGRDVAALQTRLDELNRQTAELTQAKDNAQTRADDAQRAVAAAQATVTAAGDTATAEQQAALTAAQTALTGAENALTAAQTALTNHNEQITGLNTLIANETAVNDVIANADQLDILVGRINNATPVVPAPAPEADQ